MRAMLKSISRNRFPYILLLPMLVCMVGVMIYPLFMGFWVSLTNKFLMASEKTLFIGFNNYIKLVNDKIFLQACKNTFVWALTGVSGTTVIGLVLALLLNRRFLGRDIFRALFLLPWSVPYVSVGILWRWLFQDSFGHIDQLLMGLGLTSGPVGFLSNPAIALYSITGTMIWRHYPFSMLVFLAALQGINEDLYEVAEVDGANTLKKFIYITLPGIRSAMVMVVLLQFIWIFNHFDIVYIMTRGGPARATELLSTYAYESAFRRFTIGYGSTIGSIMFVVLVITMLLYLRIIERVDH